MSFVFADSFDPYTALADMTAGYWDSGASFTNYNLVAGRFTGSRALNLTGITSAANAIAKTSAINDAVHHIVVAFQQTAALSGTTLGTYIAFYDGATIQCSIVFRSDGAILLTSGGVAGTVLATYTGAITLQNQWFAFEFEVVINNTTGAFRVRKNGNTSNDFDSGATLNTRTSANNYANKIAIPMNATVGQIIDDLIWRSDASSVAWVGDVRSYVRMPASDVSTQFTRGQSTLTQTSGQNTTVAVASGTARYSIILTSPVDGTIGTVTVSMSAGYTGNLKCAIFSANASNQPGAVLGSATTISNPATGTNTFTFPTPVAVTKNQQYFVGWDSDTSSGTWNGWTTLGWVSTTAYAAFPAANPVVTQTGAQQVTYTVFITPTTNNSLVNEAQQDGATTYVYDSNVGDADFYGIASIPVTPASIVAVTTRGFLQKSDAGSRSGGVQLKSGATTVSATGVLSTSWAWAYRVDTVDPATGVAWTPTAVNNLQCGPVLSA